MHLTNWSGGVVGRLEVLCGAENSTTPSGKAINAMLLSGEELENWKFVFTEVHANRLNFIGF